MARFRDKERSVNPAMVEVEVGRHNTNDLKKKAARGDKLTADEVKAIIQVERPTKAQVRPTGRVTRTGTQTKETGVERKHKGKWAARNETTPESRTNA